MVPTTKAELKAAALDFAAQAGFEPGLDKLNESFNIRSTGHYPRYFTEGGKPDNKDGFVLSTWISDGDWNGLISTFGCWRQDRRVAFRSWEGSKIDPARAERIKGKVADHNHKVAKERTRLHAETAAEVTKLLNATPDARPDHWYLKDKGVQAYPGVKQRGDTLMIPICDIISGQPISVQHIFKNRKGEKQKRQKKGGRKAGGGFFLGELDSTNVIRVAEGYSTAASIHEAIGGLVVCAFDCFNLEPVALALRKRYGADVGIHMCADDDQWTRGNPGVTKAQKAARAVGGSFVIPTFANTEDEPTDFNDLHAMEGLDVVRKQLGNPIVAESSSSRPSSIGSSSFEASIPADIVPFGEVVVDDEWPPVAPLQGQLAPVEKLDPKLLPDAFRDYVEDVACRMQCPIEYVAAGIMVSFSSVVGRQLAIRPKVHDDWTVIPNLWGAVVGPPSAMKTPALEQATCFIDSLEAQAREEHESALADHQCDEIFRESSAKGLKKKLDKLSGGNSAERAQAKEIAAQIHELDNFEEPKRKRYQTSDVTVEKLAELLAENRAGILVRRDELTGLLRSLDRTDMSYARSFYLETWNGNIPFSCDRVIRGMTEVEGACVSVLGGIQPGPLSEYLNPAMHGAIGDDGLIQRFQLLFWPDQNPQWRNVDRLPNAEAKALAAAAFTRASNLDVQKFDSEATGLKVPYVRLAPEAQPLFNQWREGWEARLKSDDLHPAVEAHLSKYRSLVPSIALLCFLATNLGEIAHGQSLVDAQSLVRALGWSNLLESHARRTYGQTADRTMLGARELLKHIETGDLGATFRERDAYRSHWRFIDRESTPGILRLLEDHGYIRVERAKPHGGGRPFTFVTVNPAVLDGGE